ncbi:DUF2963 domain-containing protein [Candidatus Phytoplasma pruni]|uniref:DUF2963 domain-containing protein n=1 Tax=Candidatus Phytoplasma pruni TaxID=479893 RepID=A0A851H9K9_9MOLU|nr:DUF2963 domain-containing protein [Candidatus Phytoplasma pruni]NWN45557.1 DUF2963 domain-containing protein [Candidatus Phytoplasma pruni]
MTNNHKSHVQAEQSTPNNRTTTHINRLKNKVITEYNHLDQIIKRTHYSSHFNPPDFDNENNYYLYFIQEYDPQTGNKTKEINYYSAGSVEDIWEYDPITENRIKYTSYDFDGGCLTEDYNPQTDNVIKRTIRRSDGSLEMIRDYDPQTEKETKSIHYLPDGKTIDYIIIYNPKKHDPQSRTTHY